MFKKQLINDHFHIFSHAVDRPLSKTRSSVIAFGNMAKYAPGSVYKKIYSFRAKHKILKSSPLCIRLNGITLRFHRILKVNTFIYSYVNLYINTKDKLWKRDCELINSNN